MQERRNALVRAWRLSETLPHVIPASAALHQALGGSFPILILGIDAERRPAHQTERLPSRIVQPRSECLGSTQPSQEITDRIGNGEVIEVLGIEATATQAIQGRRGEHRQCPGDGIASQRVPSDIKAQAFIGNEERFDRPVLSVLLVPRSPSEEQFDQRLICRTAIAAGAQLLSAHARQVQNRRDIRRRRIWECSVHDALEPNRRPCSRLRVVVTQREQVGQLGSETRNDWSPDGILIRPQNGDRR